MNAKADCDGSGRNCKNCHPIDGEPCCPFCEEGENKAISK